MFGQLESIGARPKVFGAYTAEELWADPHISEQMLAFHLDGAVALASRTSDFIDRSLAWLTATTGIDTGTGVLDLGCGPGLYSNPIAALGARTVGVDFSARSLEHARRSATAGTMATFIHGNYLDVEIPEEYDVVLLAMCDYCALSPAQRRTLLERIILLLRPGGRFVFDVYGMRSMQERNETARYAPMLMDGFWSREKYHGFVHTFLYETAAVSLDKYDIIEADRWRTIYNWSQHFSPASLERELAICGFDIEAVFGDLTGADLHPDPSEFCVIATAR